MLVFITEIISKFTWPSFISSLIENVLGLGVIILPLFFIFKNKFAEKMGENVADLLVTKHRTTIEESIKADFAKQNSAFEIQYSYIHQKQSDIIIKLYQKLAVLLESAKTLTCPFVPGATESERKDIINKKIEIFDNAYKDINDFYLKNKLLIPAEMCAQINNYTQKMRDARNHYLAEDVRATSNILPDDEKMQSEEEKLNINTSVWLSTQELESMEKEFRKLLYTN